jgi:quercetin dioxygenase-like cupin family protein
MKHFYYGDVPLEEIAPDARDTYRRWLVDAGTGAINFTVAEVEVKSGGNTLRHAHPFEHTMFILEGIGEVIESTGTSPIASWEVIYIEPNELHQIRNTGVKTLKFLSVEPVQKKEEKRT